jgi:hypothetical protein
MNRGWRNETGNGTLLVLNDPNDLERIGHCWMEGRLKLGDVVLCFDHSGDCFNDYILIEVFHNGIRGIPESKFGAYTLGTETKWQPSNKEYHLLLAGENVLNGIKEHPLHKEIFGK